MTTQGEWLTSSEHCFPLTEETYINCCKGCNKPGLGHPQHDPSANECADCALMCCPCAFTIDLLTLPYRAFRRLFRYCFLKELMQGPQETKDN